MPNQELGSHSPYLVNSPPLEAVRFCLSMLWYITKNPSVPCARPGSSCRAQGPDRKDVGSCSKGKENPSPLLFLVGKNNSCLYASLIKKRYHQIEAGISLQLLSLFRDFHRKSRSDSGIASMSIASSAESPIVDIRAKTQCRSAS